LTFGVEGGGAEGFVGEVFAGRSGRTVLSGALGFGAGGGAARGTLGLDAGAFGRAADGGGGSVGRELALTVKTCWHSKFGHRIDLPASSGCKLNFVSQWGH